MIDESDEQEINTFLLLFQGKIAVRWLFVRVRTRSEQRTPLSSPGRLRFGQPPLDQFILHSFILWIKIDIQKTSSCDKIWFHGFNGILYSFSIIIKSPLPFPLIATKLLRSGNNLASSPELGAYALCNRLRTFSSLPTPSISPNPPTLSGSVFQTLR